MSDHVPYVPAERSARERDIAVLAERPTEPAGLVALAAALADRLARTGGPARSRPRRGWRTSSPPDLPPRQAPAAGRRGRASVRWGEGPVLRGQVIRAGRALLPWDQERLARQAGVSVAAVRELKAGRIAGRGLSAVAAQAALERAGLRFLAGEAGLGRGLRYASAGA